MRQPDGLETGAPVRPGWILTLSLAACGGPAIERLEPPPPPESPAGIDRAVFYPQVETVRALAERACACTEPDCFVAVDEDLAAYGETTTMNDPLDGIETWPADLDAIANAALLRVIACATDGGHRLAAFGTLGSFRIRRFTLLRDAACACTDADCALRAQAAYLELIARLTRSASTVEELKTFQPMVDETRACIDGPLGEQAVLDLRALRAEACACADAACADRVWASLQAWGEHNKFTDMFETSEDELAEIGGELNACLAAARAPVQ